QQQHSAAMAADAAGAMISFTLRKKKTKKYSRSRNSSVYTHAYMDHNRCRQSADCEKRKRKQVYQGAT
ncbi:hypothetical protein V1478_014129, partial [Vespula squamosa]